MKIQNVGKILEYIFKMKKCYFICLFSILLITLYIFYHNWLLKLNHENKNLIYSNKKAVDKKCSSFTQDGVFKNDKWHPLSCTMHEYTEEEFNQCMVIRAKTFNKLNHFVFIGDSVMRQQFFSLFDTQKSFIKMQRDSLFIDNLTQTLIEFKWKPEGYNVLKFVQTWNQVYKTSKPDLVFVNFCFWHIKRAYWSAQNLMDQKYIDIYQNDVKQVADELTKHTDKTEIIWVHSKPLYESKITTQSWTEPINQYYTKFPNSTKTIVDFFIDIASQILKDSNIKEWFVFHYLANYSPDSWQKSKDGVHYGQKHILTIRQIIVNYICNSITSHIDGTCCTNSF